MLSVLLILSYPCSLLLASNPIHSNYTRSLWRAQDGLPEATVQALIETHGGSLWVGTTGGLTRFDGTHFTPYPSRMLSAPGVNSIFCLAQSPDGSLWIGTEGGGLLHLQGNQVISYNAENGLTDGFVRSVLVDKHQNVWVGTDSGLFQVDGDRVRRTSTRRDIGSLAVHGLAEDSSGRIWVGGARLFTIENGRTHPYDLPGSYSSNRVKTILQTSDGVVWVGTVGGLERLVSGRFQRVVQINNTVRTLRQTSDGTLWIGTIGGGLWTYKDGSFAHLDGLLPGNTVLTILEDDSHQVWIGLQDGLVRLSTSPVHLVPLPGGSDIDYETTSGDTGDGVWAVASRVYRIADESARPFAFPQLPNVKVRNLFRDRHGFLWVGTDGSGVYCLRPHSVKHYSAPRELTNNFIRAFLESRNGDIWVATDEGVNRLTPQGVQKLGMKDGLVYFSTRSLLEDASGDIWIGTDQGLSHWHDGRFVHDEATDALQHEKIWSILQDSRGMLWFGTRDHGLFFLRSAQLGHITKLEGLESNSIYQILEDPKRRFWLSGPDAITSIPEADLYQVVAGAKEHFSVSTYGMPYGSEDAQMYGGRQPSGYVDPRGYVWFPSNKGAVHVVLNAQSVAAPPPVVLQKLTLDGRDLPVEQDLHLPSQMSRLELQFAPVSLRSQTGLQYRYQLNGFDKGWTDAGTNLSVSYTNLPAGHYRFLVQAFNVGNPSAVSEASLDFLKEPFLWQRGWFLALCASTLSLLAWAIHKARVHQVKLRFKAVLDERSRLAREMHDTVIQGCTSVSALLEAVASMQADDPHPGEPLLRYARAQVRTTINEARNSVWNLRHEEEASTDLVQSLRAIASQTGMESGIPVECVVTGEARPIAGATTRELLMVVREAAYNAVRHGLAQSIQVSVTFTAKSLTVRVADDGIGFSPAEVPADGHYGITGMRERLQRLGGTFQIRSAPDEGTEVILTMEHPGPGRARDAHTLPVFTSGRSQP